MRLEGSWTFQEPRWALMCWRNLAVGAGWLVQDWDGERGTSGCEFRAVSHHWLCQQLQDCVSICRVLLLCPAVINLSGAFKKTYFILQFLLLSVFLSVLVEQPWCLAPGRDALSQHSPCLHQCERPAPRIQPGIRVTSALEPPEAAPRCFLKGKPSWSATFLGIYVQPRHARFGWKFCFFEPENGFGR